MKILELIKSAFSEKNIKFTFFVIIVIISLLYFRSCDKLKEEKLAHERDNKMYENNLIAMNDSIKTYFDKSMNQYVSEKTSYLVNDLADLKKYNEDLYKKLSNMGNVIAGISSQVNINLPKMIKEGPVIQDEKDSTKFTLPFDFEHKDSGLEHKIMGRTTFNVLNNKVYNNVSLLDTNYFNIKLTYAYTEEDGKYIIKATSPSSLVKFTELDGALKLDKITSVSQTINPWTLGPYIGVGLNTDMKGLNSRFGWSIGLSLSYNLLPKFKK